MSQTRADVIRLDQSRLGKYGLCSMMNWVHENLPTFSDREGMYRVIFYGSTTASVMFKQQKVPGTLPNPGQPDCLPIPSALRG